jgi:hypothetical protein
MNRTNPRSWVLAALLAFAAVLCWSASPADAATIIDLGPGPAQTLAVSAQQEVLFSSGLWVSGTVRIPAAPASDPSATFAAGGSRGGGLNAGGQDPGALSDSGLVMGSALAGAGSTPLRVGRTPYRDGGFWR